MSDFFVVALKIAAMFLVMALGWLARRRTYVDEHTGRALSRLLVDMIFPALVFTQMLKTVTPQALRAGWYIPLLGAGLILVAELVAACVLPLFRARGHRPTALFLAAIPNWVYLPLPIVASLFGDAGVRDVLLYNVGSQLVLWTLGVATLRGARPDREALRQLAANPGLWATAAGIGLALLWPAGRTLEQIVMTQTAGGLLAAAAVVQALAMIGSLTIPLSLLITGVQLGGLNLEAHRPTRELTGILLVRLVAAPVVTVAVAWGLSACGFTIPTVPRLTGYLIAAMPVAITCSIMTERFGGDASLAARAIFYSTLWSLVTVPAFYYGVGRYGW